MHFYQGRAEDFLLPEAVTFFACEAHKNFLTASGKFQVNTAPPIFAFNLGGKEFTWGGKEIMID